MKHTAGSVARTARASEKLSEYIMFFKPAAPPCFDPGENKIRM
jgi:hypothetical protein